IDAGKQLKCRGLAPSDVGLLGEPVQADEAPEHQFPDPSTPIVDRDGVYSRRRTSDERLGRNHARARAERGDDPLQSLRRNSAPEQALILGAELEAMR